MNKQILILLPSRSNGNNRELNVERFIESWRKHTEGFSDLCILLDDDDHFRYKRHKDVLYNINTNVRFVPKLNRAAMQYKDSYKYIANFSDDFIIHTQWESQFLEFFNNNSGVGIVYGNDLLQSEKLPTAVCMSSIIISTLGYMIPTELQHMYADNFWKDLGMQAGILKYFPNIIFEHVHPDAGKAVRDAQYVHAAETVWTDQNNYTQYLADRLQFDVNKILNILKTLS